MTGLGYSILEVSCRSVLMVAIYPPRDRWRSGLGFLVKMCQEDFVRPSVHPDCINRDGKANLHIVGKTRLYT
jgi:hypothetical protein